MADRGLSITNPLMESMGAGLRVPAARFGDDPATRTGLGSIQPTDMDTAVSGRTVMPDAPEAVSGLDAFRARNDERLKGMFNAPVRPAQAPVRPPATVYFNQSTNEMFAGDQAFKADDTQSALQAAAKPANTTRPQGEGWTSLPEGSFDRYLSSFSERRGTGELLGRGAKQIAYGLTALPGSLLTLAGAESIGEPMRQAAQDVFGESENEQLRSYLISQRSSFGEKVTDTVIEAVPMLFSAVFGGWAASALGAAGKTGAVASAARTLGPRGGAAITTMPIHMTSFFDAAERNGMDVTDPQVRAEIVGGTLFNTVLDMYGAGGAAGRLGSLLSPAARNALQQASSTTSRNLLRRAGVEGIRTGAAEAVTETMQTFMEMALFDPVVRENMSPADWKFLAPHMSENYVENLKLAGVSGAVLGFGAGATIGAFNGPKPPIPTNQPTDLINTATEQAQPLLALPPPTETASSELYGQQSFQPLGLPYFPGSGPIEVPPTGPGQVMDLPKTATGPLTTPLTPGQIALQRAGTGGLRAEDRQSGKITLPYGDRRDVRTGEVLDAPQVGRARLLGLPAPPPIAALPAPGIAPVADYYGSPEGLVPGAAPAAAAPATTAPLGTRGATLLAPGASTTLLPAPAGGTMADPLRAILAQREAAAAQQATADQQAADQQAENERATAEAARQAQLATGAQQAQVEDAYTQREAQLRSQADNQVRVAEEQVTAARGAWDGFRNKKRLTLMPKAKRTVAQSVEFDTLAPAAQQRWLDAVRAGKATEKLYKTLRNAAASTPAPEAQSTAVVERRRDAYPDGNTAVEYRIGNAGVATVQIAPDGTAHLTNIQIGDADSTTRGKGLGTQAYTEIGQKLAAEGVRLQSTQWTKHNTAISPAALRVWEKLTGSNLAHQIGTEQGKVLDRFTSQEEVRDVPIYEFGPKPTGGKKAPGQTRIKETAAKPAAPKKAALKAGTTKKPAAEPKSAAAPKAAKSEAAPAAAPVVEPEPEVQVPAKKPAPERVAALRTRVDELTDEQGLALQAAVESSTGQAEVDLDKAIESDTKVVEDALDLVLGGKRGPMVVRKEVVEVTAARVGAADPVIDLGKLITDINSGVEPESGWTGRFEELVAAVRSSKTPDAVVAVGPKQVRLVDFVKPDGKPNTSRVKGKLRINPVESDGKPFLSTWNTVDGVVGLDGKPVTPLATGRVQMLIRNFTSKFARAPKVTVARNQADLKAKNPDLYKQAVAARPQGDFDTIPAMGYSFGDGQVIIFTDRIGTEQQLQFVLAHEALGHYGLRSVMPAGKFNAAMDQVYNSDPRVAATVDQAVEVRGLSRAEATEEYLADYAAVLDMSLLRRVAGAMKTALNAVGFRFSDDMVRHLLRMSRRYVRNGKQDSLFTVESIFTDIRDIESGTDQQGTGRFKSGFAIDNKGVDRLVYNVHGLPRTVDEITAALKPAKEKVSLYAENILRKAFSLTGFNALDNAGSARQNEILSKGGEVTADLRNRGDAKLRFALDREVRIAGIKVLGGITETEQLAASRLNYGQQDAIRGKVEARIASVTKALKDAGKPTRMFTIVGDTVKPNEDTIAAYAKAGTLEIAEAKAILAKDDRYKKIADELNKDHNTWKAYLEVRDVEQMVDVEFVRANYEALVEDRKNGIEAVESMLTSDTDKITSKEEAMLRQAMDKHYELYSAGSTIVEGNVVATDGSAKAAEEFLKKLNEAFIAVGFDTTKEDALRVYFKDKMADDFIAQLVGLRKRITRTPENEFLLQKTITDIGASERSYSSAETSVRQMLAQGYTPIVRKDEQFQMRLVAYVPGTNEFVQLSEDARGQAAYRVFGTAQEATTLANLANATLSDTTTPVDAGTTDVEITTLKDGTTKRLYKVEGRRDGKSDFTSQSVELRFEVSAAASGVHTSLELNVHEFLRGAQRFGFSIKPSQLEKIIVAMTAQDARARKRLQQTGNPGYEVQGGVTAIEAMAGHVDTRSALIAKIKMRPALDKLMNLKLPSSRKLWFGDTKRLDDLKKAYDAALVNPNANEGVRDLAKREYTDYAYKMGKTITTVNGMSVNLGNKYFSEGQTMMAFINGNRDVNETDWGAGPVASWVRRWAGAFQLGGTLTQPIMNNIGPFTNFIPWLSSYNEKNGFGGGAGPMNAYTQYLKAVTDVGGSGGLSFSERALKMHTGDYWNQVATGLETHTGVTKPEAEFISKETFSGILTPAQANSLLGASRNFTTNPAVRRALDKWMFFYVSSEQATRRAAALAAFRVEWERQTSAIGKAPNDKLSDAEYKRIHARASDFATQGVLLTLGDYGAKARPAVWRSGFQSFLYMYKVWPTTTIQTLSRLSWPGKAMMLAPLIIASGVAGLPFAEDGEDFIDTVLQRTGRTSGSVRIELARLIDEIWPGASPYILKGWLSSALGTDVAGRFSAGDFLPGTAGLLPGQELSATVREVLGPAWGFIEGTFVGGSQLAAAPFSDTATVVDAMRGGPVTIFRALGDAIAYNSAGAVIDKRGYVIDPDLTTGMLIGRVLGFTPASVASQYEVIRLAKRETNYQKQVVTKFRTALLKAELSGDRVRAASIRRTVKDWNEATDGTLLEIKNFEKNYQRLFKLANMSAKNRFIQSVGKNNRDAIELTNELIGFD